MIVANACTDGTVEWVRELKQKHLSHKLIRIILIEESLPGKSNALNKATNFINTSLIAFVDDDHRVDEDYIISIEKAFINNPDIMCFCGKIIPDWNGSEPSWVHDEGQYKIYPLPIPHFDHEEKSFEIYGNGPIPGGGNLVIRKEVFRIVGKFDTELGPEGHNLGGAEDIEWVRRALEKGLRLRYDPEIIQFHYIDYDRLKVWYLMRKAYLRTASIVRLSEEAKRAKFVPKYLLRKIITVLFHGLINCLVVNRRRFFLVRLSAVFGEVKGFLQAKSDKSSC